jgi:TAZ zinc finger
VCAHNPTSTAKMQPVSGGTDVGEEEMVIRQGQQRLLLLKHARKCPAAAGACTQTRHCDEMKTLWKHITVCKDQKCAMRHCISSRGVLHHFTHCKDAQCRICDPVRKEGAKMATPVPVAETAEVKYSVTQLSEDTIALSMHLRGLLRTREALHARLSKLTPDCDEFARLAVTTSINRAAIVDTTFYIRALAEMNHGLVTTKRQPNAAGLHCCIRLMGEKRQKTSEATPTSSSSSSS